MAAGRLPGWAGFVPFLQQGERDISAAGPRTDGSIQNVGKSLSFSERIPHLAAKYDPAVVVLDGGRNDEFPPRKDVLDSDGVDHRGGTPNLAGRADRLHTTRFLARPGDDLGFDDDFMTQVQSDPAAKGVIFIDPISTFVGTDTSGLLTSDGIHPNREGEQRMTDGALRLTRSLPAWARRHELCTHRVRSCPPHPMAVDGMGGSGCVGGNDGVADSAAPDVSRPSNSVRPDARRCQPSGRRG